MVVGTFAGVMLGQLWLLGHLGHLWALHGLPLDTSQYKMMKFVDEKNRIEFL